MKFFIIYLLLIIFSLSNVDALIINQTKTGLGQQFYTSFTQSLLAKHADNSQLIALTEKAGPFSGNQLVLSINNKEIAAIAVRPQSVFNINKAVEPLSEQAFKYLRKLQFKEQLQKVLKNEKN